MAVSLPSAPEGEDRMTSFTTVQTAAMQRALRAAASPDAPPGPNPRVGCVILSPDGDVLAEGHHRGAGSAHAEVDALANLAATVFLWWHMIIACYVPTTEMNQLAT